MTLLPSLLGPKGSRPPPKNLIKIQPAVETRYSTNGVSSIPIISLPMDKQQTLSHILITSGLASQVNAHQMCETQRVKIGSETVPN